MNTTTNTRGVSEAVDDTDFTLADLRAVESIKVGEVLTAKQWEAECQFIRHQDEIIRNLRATLEAALSAQPAAQGDAVAYVCSNPACGVVHAVDPCGHCPACAQESGAGWSTTPRRWNGYRAAHAYLSGEVRELVEDARWMLSQLPHNEFSHDFVKDEKRCDTCKRIKRIAAAIAKVTHP